MAHWLHSTIGPATLFADEASARAALKKHVAAFEKKGYKAKEMQPDHFMLTHATAGNVEAYIDTEGSEVGGDDET